MADSDKKLRLAPSSRKQHDMTHAAHKAYTSIRAAILTGELKYGENLVERDLAERIGLSRTPVREAINRLRIEGLVMLERNSRNYVAHFSEHDVEEILDLKALLESHSAARAASRISEESIQRLKVLAEEMERVVADDAIDAQEAYYPLNHEFHSIIIAAADSPRMELMLNTSLATPFDAIGRFRSELGILESFRQSCQHHRNIIAALEARDTAQASGHMRDHLLSLVRVEISRRGSRELGS